MIYFQLIDLILKLYWQLVLKNMSQFLFFSVLEINIFQVLEVIYKPKSGRRVACL